MTKFWNPYPVCALLTAEGVVLREIAPGIDLEKDVLSQMDFRPIIKDVKLMDASLFKE